MDLKGVADVFFAAVSAVPFSVQEIPRREVPLSSTVAFPAKHHGLWHHSLKLLQCCGEVLIVLVVPSQLKVYGTEFFANFQGASRKSVQ